MMKHGPFNRRLRISRAVDDVEWIVNHFQMWSRPTYQLTGDVVNVICKIFMINSKTILSCEPLSVDATKSFDFFAEFI